jgi:hypothetical protein
MRLGSTRTPLVRLRYVVRAFRSSTRPLGSLVAKASVGAVVKARLADEIHAVRGNADASGDPGRRL